MMNGCTRCPQCKGDLEFFYEYDHGVRYHADGSGTPPEEEFNYDCDGECELTDKQLEMVMDRAHKLWDKR